MTAYMTTEPGLTETRLILIITGKYTCMNDEATVKFRIRQWRAGTGVDDPVKENFVQRMIRYCWTMKPAKKRGEIHCLVEMDKDRMVYTARFHNEKTS